jgi:acetyl esterase/lipase
MATDDAQRTVRLVRFRAAEYRIDPHKIGVLGFSAGGHPVADIGTHPDFAVALYPGHLWMGPE